MSSPSPDFPLPMSAPVEQVFPTLTPEQIGASRPMGASVRFAAGRSSSRRGRGTVERRSSSSRRAPSSSSGSSAERRGDRRGSEARAGSRARSACSRDGRRSSTSGVGEPGEVIDVKQDDLLALVQTDSELGDIFMRAFILRRVELIAHGFGDAVLIGSNFCQATLRVKEFLTRNGHPYTSSTSTRDSGRAGPARPVRRQPGRRAGAHLPRERSCFATRATLRDRRLSGFQRSDRSGRACATCSSSGRGRPVSRRRSTGPRRGSTSWCSSPRRPADRPARARRSRTTSGFRPASRARSSRQRALTQAEKFGAELMIAKGARRLSCERKPYAIEIDGGTQRSRADAWSSRPARSIGSCRSRTCSASKARACTTAPRRSSRNCAAARRSSSWAEATRPGQAAVFLAQTAKRVHVLVRAAGLAESMSRYLIRRIEDEPGDRPPAADRDRGPRRDQPPRARELARQRDRGRHDARHPARLLDDRSGSRARAGSRAASRSTRAGSSRRGRICRQEDLAAAHWPLARPPHLLETSLPGVSRGRRRALRQRQARRLGGRPGGSIAITAFGPPGSPGIERGKELLRPLRPLLLPMCSHAPMIVAMIACASSQTTGTAVERKEARCSRRRPCTPASRRTRRRRPRAAGPFPRRLHGAGGSPHRAATEKRSPSPRPENHPDGDRASGLRDRFPQGLHAGASMSAPLERRR